MLPEHGTVCFFKTLEISARVHSILSWKTIIFIQSGVGIDSHSISENGVVIYTVYQTNKCTLIMYVL